MTQITPKQMKLQKMVNKGCEIQDKDLLKDALDESTKFEALASITAVLIMHPECCVWLGIWFSYWVIEEGK